MLDSIYGIPVSIWYLVNPVLPVTKATNCGRLLILLQTTIIASLCLSGILLTPCWTAIMATLCRCDSLATSYKDRNDGTLVLEWHRVPNSLCVNLGPDGNVDKLVSHREVSSPASHKRVCRTSAILGDW